MVAQQQLELLAVVVAVQRGARQRGLEVPRVRHEAIGQRAVALRLAAQAADADEGVAGAHGLGQLGGLRGILQEGLEPVPQVGALGLVDNSGVRQGSISVGEAAGGVGRIGHGKRAAVEQGEIGVASMLRHHPTARRLQPALYRLYGIQVTMSGTR